MILTLECVHLLLPWHAAKIKHAILIWWSLPLSEKVHASCVGVRWLLWLAWSAEEVHQITASVIRDTLLRLALLRCRHIKIEIVFLLGLLFLGPTAHVSEIEIVDVVSTR